MNLLGSSFLFYFLWIGWNGVERLPALQAQSFRARCDQSAGWAHSLCLKWLGLRPKCSQSREEGKKPVHRFTFCLSFRASLARSESAASISVIRFPTAQHGRILPSILSRIAHMSGLAKHKRTNKAMDQIGQRVRSEQFRPSIANGLRHHGS